MKTKLENGACSKTGVKVSGIGQDHDERYVFQVKGLAADI